MEWYPKNQCRLALATTALFATGLVVGLMSFVGEALAARGDRLIEQAWACSTLYSRAPIKVVNGDSRETALCLGEGKRGRQPMSRSEAWELCREQFDATTALVAWTGGGWLCRYQAH